MTNEELRDKCNQAVQEHSFFEKKDGNVSFPDISMTARTGYVYQPRLTGRLTPFFDSDEDEQSIEKGREKVLKR